jgi:large subunit ribosomal protein L29
MAIEKIRNTTDAELLTQQRELSNELFQLKFRMRMGQTESLKKMRELRKDLARVQTVARERQLGIVATPKVAAAPAKAAAAPAKAAKKTTVKKTAKK